MKHTLSFGLVIGAAVLATGGWVESAQEKVTLETRVATLEAQVENLLAMSEAQTQEVQGMRVLVDQTVRYLKQQSAGATAMLGTLSQAEKLGFTKGINFPSRETLLAGWRSQLTALSKDLPGAVPEPEEGKAKDAGKRKRRGVR